MPGPMISLLLALSHPSCTAIAPPPHVALPHVASSGTQGKAVIQAIDALLAAQQPPLARGRKSYAMQEVSCRNIFTPSAQGSSCSLAVSIDGRAEVSITTPTGSDLATKLNEALIDAGADDCNDFAHGDFLRLKNVAMNIVSSKVEFDDGSNYALPGPPNVRAGCAAGASVLQAMEAASINDCDPTRTVFIVCNKFAGTPRCSRTFFPLENVGGSQLANICVPTPAVGPTVQIGAAEAANLWKALLEAAAASGFQPSHGTLAQTTVINAKQFTWDGAFVAFDLLADNPQPPPPPTGP